MLHYPQRVASADDLVRMRGRGSREQFFVEATGWRVAAATQGKVTEAMGSFSYGFTIECP